jgi:hypothetical protein
MRIFQPKMLAEEAIIVLDGIADLDGVVSKQYRYEMFLRVQRVVFKLKRWMDDVERGCDANAGAEVCRGITSSSEARHVDRRGGEVEGGLGE